MKSNIAAHSDKRDINKGLTLITRPERVKVKTVSDSTKSVEESILKDPSPADRCERAINLPQPFRSREERPSNRDNSLKQNISRATSSEETRNENALNSNYPKAAIIRKTNGGRPSQTQATSQQTDGAVNTLSSILNRSDSQKRDVHPESRPPVSQSESNKGVNFLRRTFLEEKYLRKLIMIRARRKMVEKKC